MKFLWIGIYLVNLIAVGFLWKTGLSGVFPQTSGQTLIAIGDLAGLIAAYSLLWQLLLMSRLWPLDRAFGRLELTALHRKNGYIAFGFLIIHPILLTLGYASNSNLGLAHQFIQFITSFQDVWKALVALILIVTSVTASVTIARRYLSYEAWYLIHITSYLSVLLAFGHQLSVGEDFINRPIAAIYWYALYVLVAASIVVFRVLQPLFQSYKHRFVVSQVISEAKGITSIIITGRNMEGFRFQPGQFANWRFLAPTIWFESHPFSISQEYNGHSLRLSVKGVGGYTRHLSQLSVGTQVIIEGPHGRFTPNLRTKPDVLLIAGGIGVTPLRALLDTFLREKADVFLLYRARNSEELAFTKELEALVNRYPSFKLKYLLDADLPSIDGHGVITVNTLREQIPDVQTREVFLCGPPALLISLRTMLTEIGVPPALQHEEHFAY